jgi:hypothetical protein
MSMTHCVTHIRDNQRSLLIAAIVLVARSLTVHSTKTLIIATSCLHFKKVLHLVDTWLTVISYIMLVRLHTVSTL